MPSIKITPCTTADIYTLQDIAINSYGDHYLYLWHDGGMWYLNRCFSEDALKKELEDANAAFFLIYAEEELVGFLKFNISKEIEGYSAEEAMELERIYLTKSASGKGIGRAAVNFTKQVAQEMGKKVIWLKAMDSSRSVNFYEQNGFEKCGTYNLDFEQMKEEYRGMYVMKLPL
ncbi:GNAT family N-acetyltransferase [Pontibacter cellulosilyticus]|uniref:GNAT family N-acetyltransferase n=1 Tax=Pontibacter cellulosilyticus TaxID=1720253 RepID=A0A923NA39_9BACT|nr:GNAT family N-acetyltransferase [Pontibacter cellulosilyticus]MBC5994999.1 GNAT family N-acetyltransferase [Pontibacter cellulosilyticus]